MSRPFPVKGTNDTPDVRKPNLLLSLDSYKYQHALAVQKVRRDPDGVYVHLVYHLVWNMANRKPLLTHRPDTRGLIEDGFSACGEEIGGFARVLWLASDHIHVYVESDGEKSVDAVVKVLRRVSARTLRDFLARGARWEGAYFAQTVG
ncbi:MAG: transposase [Syntrophorhabdales bacterium]|jgi:REP element-mobilizing transposase RayT